MGAVPPPRARPPMSLVKLSVGTLIGRVGETDRMTSDKLLHVVQRHSAGRPPVVVLAGTGGAVRPAVFVHGEGVVRFGALVFRTSADEVDAIVHQTD